MSFHSKINKVFVNRIFKSLHSFSSALHFFVMVLFVFSCISVTFAQSKTKQKWVGTWSTAPQLVETNNKPPSPGLSNNTIRQIVHVSIGGDSLRMRLTNEFGTSAVKINSVHIAVSTGNGSIDTTTDKTIYFSGMPEVSIASGTAVTSDPFQFSLQPLSNVAITIYFGETSSDISGHPGSRTTSYILTGNEVTKADFSGAVTTDHWYNINTIDVLAPDSASAIAILGDSITDGRGSGTNKQNRWPDELARRLQANAETKNVAVLNEGIGGNCVLGTCLGPSALSRFNRDVLQQSGIKYLIIFEGINDIGNAWGSGVGNNLINAYKQMINSAHANGIFVYGATLLPFGGSSYSSVSHEAERQIVNKWIRNGGLFDAVIDLDKAMRNPADTLSLISIGDSGDHLHPSEAGHHMMAEAVDLTLFVGSDTLSHADKGKSIYFEPECAKVGKNWNIVTDATASNGEYVIVKAGVQSISAAPTDSSSVIVIPFTTDTTGNFSVYARVNCPTADDDSYWVKMDNADFVMFNGLNTSGWEWKKFSDYTLTKGEHKITIAYREDGAKLDKICVTNSVNIPTGIGEEAENICPPTDVENVETIPDGYVLEQNYPNPFNPTTKIKFSLPQRSYTTLVVFDTLGKEVKTLISKELAAGYHQVEFNANELPSGVYCYRIQSGDFIQTKKMILIK